MVTLHTRCTVNLLVWWPDWYLQYRGTWSIDSDGFCLWPLQQILWLCLLLMLINLCRHAAEHHQIILFLVETWAKMTILQVLLLEPMCWLIGYFNYGYLWGCMHASVEKLLKAWGLGSLHIMGVNMVVVGMQHWQRHPSGWRDLLVSALDLEASLCHFFQRKALQQAQR